MTFSIMTGLVVGADRAELLERARQTMAVTVASGEPEDWLVKMRSDGWIVGTTDEVRGQLEALAEAGIERFFLQHLDHRDLDTVALLGAEFA
jgi:alkanesulfonate monooxygenase SsuD/methylene tetrahydromethanopterin reductase-like flavin-dependent oxidoreductase (luciferase family)